MGRGQGLGVGQGRKTYSWCFMSLGVVFLLIYFKNFTFGAISFFSLKTLRFIHSLSFRTHKVVSFLLNTVFIS